MSFWEKIVFDSTHSLYFMCSCFYFGVVVFIVYSPSCLYKSLIHAFYHDFVADVKMLQRDLVELFIFDRQCNLPDFDGVLAQQ